MRRCVLACLLDELKTPMKIILQCAGRKQAKAGCFQFRGRKVQFVSRPEIAKLEGSAEFFYFKPDDVNTDAGKTWQNIVEYNAATENPFSLFAIDHILTDPSYLAVKKYAELTTAELYILSAGWGLFAESFCSLTTTLPFSKQKNVPKYAIRSQCAEFNTLIEFVRANRAKRLHFFGGQDYLPLLYSLTADIRDPRLFTIFTVFVPKRKDLSTT